MDRCDHAECGARALFEVTLSSGGVLLFCGHHGAKNTAALVDAGARVVEIDTMTEIVPQGVPLDSLNTQEA